MYVTDFAPIRQAAVARLRNDRDLMKFSGIGHLMSAVQGMKSMPPPNYQQVARIHAALSGMGFGGQSRIPSVPKSYRTPPFIPSYDAQNPYQRQPKPYRTPPFIPSYGAEDPYQRQPKSYRTPPFAMETLPYTYNDQSRPTGMQKLPYPKGYPNDMLQQLLYKLGQGR
jgi:hypothetical protein